MGRDPFENCASAPTSDDSICRTAPKGTATPCAPRVVIQVFVDVAFRCGVTVWRFGMESWGADKTVAAVELSLDCHYTIHSEYSEELLVRPSVYHFPPFSSVDLSASFSTLRSASISVFGLVLRQNIQGTYVAGKKGHAIFRVLTPRFVIHSMSPHGVYLFRQMLGAWHSYMQQRGLSWKLGRRTDSKMPWYI